MSNMLVAPTKQGGPPVGQICTISLYYQAVVW
jgi:hypothetical protein